MSIDEVVLFVSIASETCTRVIDLIRRANMPVKIVRLDTPEMREKALNGKLFQVKHVPNLVIKHSDGKLQQFIGAEKIVKWVEMMTKPPPAPIQPTPVPAEVIDNDSDSEEEVVVKKPKKSKKKAAPPPKKKKKKSPKAPPQQISGLSFSFPQSKNPEQQRQQQAALAAQETQIFQSEDDDEEEDGVMVLDTYEDSSQGSYKAMKRPPPGNVDNLITGGKNAGVASMASIMSNAAKMQKEWEESQGAMQGEGGY